MYKKELAVRYSNSISGRDTSTLFMHPVYQLKDPFKLLLISGRSV
jgi:hypothetical protein